MSLKPVFHAQRRRSTIITLKGILKRQKDKTKEVVLYPLIPFEDQPVCCHNYHEPFKVDQMRKCIKSSQGVHIKSFVKSHAPTSLWPSHKLCDIVDRLWNPDQEQNLKEKKE